jgi:plastocyanin
VIARTPTGLLAAAACAVLVLVGCTNRTANVNRRPQSGSSTAAAVDGLQTVRIEADDKYRFTPDTITVHPGQVKIILVNTGRGAPHNLQVTGIPGDFVPLAANGQTTTATFTAPAPGRYQFVCTIHVAQGQTGTLVVLPN